MALLNTSVSVTPSRNMVTLKLSVWETNPDPATNESTINYKLVISKTNSWNTSWTGWGKKIYASYTIGPKSFTKYIPTYNYNGEVTSGSTIASGKFKVAHNSDGNKSITISLSFTDNADGNNDGDYYTPGDASKKSVTKSLEYIPRASVPTIEGSLTSAAMGTTITINTNRYVDTFTHTISYKFGNATGVIAEDVTENTTWTLPITLANQIPNLIEGTATIICNTYSGETLIGTKELEFIAYIPDNIKPSISSASIADGNSQIAQHNFGVFVKDRSYADFSVVAAGAYSSTIASYSIELEGTKYTKPTVSELDAIFKNIKLKVGNNKEAKITVTDSRGRTSEQMTLTYTVVDYTEPKIETFIVTRTDANGNDKDDGTYAKVVLAGYVSDINSKNKCTVRVGYKIKDSADSHVFTTYVDASTSVLSVDYTQANYRLIGGFDSGKTYELVAYIEDLILPTTSTQYLSTGFDIFHFHKSGKSMAIGKKSEASDDDEKLEVALTSEFIEDVKALKNFDVQGNSTIQGSSIISGNNTISGDTYIGGNLKVGKNITTDPSEAFQSTIFGTNNSGYRLKTIRSGMDGATGFSRDSTGVAFSAGDTHGYVYTEYLPTGRAWMGGGNQNKLNWKKRVFFYEDILNFFYPVGSIYIMPTNTSPETLFGGTWELIDKEFKAIGGNQENSNWFTVNTTNCSEFTGYWYRVGHTITFDFRFKNKVRLTDDTVEIGTVKKDVIGMEDNFYFTTHASGWTDGGQCHLMAQLDAGGTFKIVDITPDSYVAADCTNYVSLVIVAAGSRKLDSACDKFYWKRIA